MSHSVWEQTGLSEQNLQLRVFQHVQALLVKLAGYKHGLSPSLALTSGFTRDFRPVCSRKRTLSCYKLQCRRRSAMVISVFLSHVGLCHFITPNEQQTKQIRNLPRRWCDAIINIEILVHFRRWTLFFSLAVCFKWKSCRDRMWTLSLSSVMMC